MSVTPDELLVHDAFVRYMSRAILGADPEVDDVVQETWCRALETPPRKRQSLRTWLGVVARNLSLRIVRARGRRRDRESGGASKEAVPATDRIIACEETRHRLIRAMLALPEEYRTVLVLRFYDGLSTRAIADRLEMPADTAKTRIRRGLERLRRQLDADHGGDRSRWLSALVALADLRPNGGANGMVRLARIMGLAMSGLLLLGTFHSAWLLPEPHRFVAAAKPAAPDPLELPDMPESLPGPRSEEVRSVSTTTSSPLRPAELFPSLAGAERKAAASAEEAAATDPADSASESAPPLRRSSPPASQAVPPSPVVEIVIVQTSDADGVHSIDSHRGDRKRGSVRLRLVGPAWKATIPRVLVQHLAGMERGHHRVSRGSTDSDGVVLDVELPRGGWEVATSDPGLLVDPDSFRIGPGESLSVQVRMPETTVSFRLRPDDDRRPVEDLADGELRLAPLSSPGGAAVARVETVAPDGTVYFHEPPPGPWVVTFRWPDDDEQSSIFLGVFDDVAEAFDLLVPSGED